MVVERLIGEFESVHFLGPKLTFDGRKEPEKLSESRDDLQLFRLLRDFCNPLDDMVDGEEFFYSSSHDHMTSHQLHSSMYSSSPLRHHSVILTLAPYSSCSLFLGGKEP
jgi:hypothetical protein